MKNCICLHLDFKTRSSNTTWDFSHGDQSRFALHGIKVNESTAQCGFPPSISNHSFDVLKPNIAEGDSHDQQPGFNSLTGLIMCLSRKLPKQKILLDTFLLREMIRIPATEQPTWNHWVYPLRVKTGNRLAEDLNWSPVYICKEKERHWSYVPDG